MAIWIVAGDLRLNFFTPTEPRLNENGFVRWLAARSVPEECEMMTPRFP